MVHRITKIITGLSPANILKVKTLLLIAGAVLLFTACPPPLFYVEIPLPQAGGVMLDLNGADAQDFPVLLKPGLDGRVSAPDREPVRAGYQFAGWFADSAGLIPFDFAGTVVTEIWVIYAKWNEILWNITFQLNDGTSGQLDAQRVRNGSYAVWKTPPSRGVGWGFAGWFIDEEGTPEAAYTFDQPVTQDKDLYAAWDAAHYYVHYSGNYVGGVVTSVPVSFGATLQPGALPPVPQREGYAFGGWYETADCQGLQWTGGVINEDKTVYAQWSAELYTVTFTKYAGSPETYTVQSGYGRPLAHITPDQLAEPGNAAAGSVLEPETGWTPWAGWGFIRWQDQQGTQWDFASPVTESITLTGVWARNSYTVTLDGMNDAPPAAITGINAGMVPALGGNPDKAGHTFAGWYTDTRCSTEYTPAPLYRDITLYAKWTVNTYTVTFDANGGSAVASQPVVYQHTVAPPAEPVRPGHTFNEWRRANGEPYNFTTPVTGEMTLFANWLPGTYYTVTLYNRHTFETIAVRKMSGTTYTPNSDAAVSARVGANGWRAEKWYTFADATERDSFQITEDTVLIARSERITVTYRLPYTTLSTHNLHFYPYPSPREWMDPPRRLSTEGVPISLDLLPETLSSLPKTKGGNVSLTTGRNFSGRACEFFFIAEYLERAPQFWIAGTIYVSDPTDPGPAMYNGVYDATDDRTRNDWRTGSAGGPAFDFNTHLTVPITLYLPPPAL